MIYLVALLVTIAAANWAIATFGLVPVAPGLRAPAGVYFAGLAFTLRDLLQDARGRGAVLVAVALGSALSAFLAPAQFVAASAAAFFLSEMVDFGVYTPLRARHWWWAVLASNAAGLVADSACFLWLAFGSLDFLLGQVVGKVWATLALVPVLWLLRRK